MVMLDCAAAERRIRPHVIETPVVRSGSLSALSGAEVYLKLENLQETGSFKPRGATHKLLSLTPAQAASGVVARKSASVEAKRAVDIFIQPRTRSVHALLAQRASSAIQRG